MDRTLIIAFNAITCIFTFQLFSRGSDYLMGNPAEGSGVFSIGDGTPPLLWGIACVGTALVSATGMVLKRWGIVRAAAVMATAIYGAFTLMVVDDVFVQRPIDDWRYFTLYLTMAAVWSVIAFVFSIRAAVDKSREGANGSRDDL